MYTNRSSLYRIEFLHTFLWMLIQSKLLYYNTYLSRVMTNECNSDLVVRMLAMSSP